MRKLNVLVYNDISEEMLNFLKESFEVKVLKYSQSDFNRSEIDLVLLHNEQKGDMHPDYYSETVGSKTNIADKYWDKYRRIKEYCFYHDIPKLGIDNGAQYLTVQAGGSLIQDVKGHKKPHTISLHTFFGGYTAPSDHHQMMYPFDIPKDKYKIIAYSKFFQSETYLNGRGEERELPENFVEPEIVYYNNIVGGALAVQGDPTTCKDTGYREAIKTLINRLIDRKL